METPLNCHLSFGSLKISRQSDLVWMDWEAPDEGVIRHLLADLSPEERERVQGEWAVLARKIQKIISEQFDS
jgi:hypothetical protein